LVAGIAVVAVAWIANRVRAWIARGHLVAGTAAALPVVFLISVVVLENLRSRLKHDRPSFDRRRFGRATEVSGKEDFCPLGGGTAMNRGECRSGIRGDVKGSLADRDRASDGKALAAVNRARRAVVSNTGRRPGNVER